MRVWIDYCGKPVPYGKAEHCTVCHQTLSGSTIGDEHRVGPHEPGGPPRKDGETVRRCLTADEMTAKGWRLDIRTGGAEVWIGRAMTEAELARIT